jgi:hypothetical protein
MANESVTFLKQKAINILREGIVLKHVTDMDLDVFVVAKKGQNDKDTVNLVHHLMPVAAALSASPWSD